MTKAPKPWKLTEDETLASINSWQNAVLYYLQQDKNNSEFLKKDAKWTKDSVLNRGLTGDEKEQRMINLNNMLGFIAQHCASFLTSQITKTLTNLNSIWQLIKKYHEIRQTETQFMKLGSLKLEPGERYEKFYHRILSHVQDNLLTTDSPLQHDGAKVTTDEELSPTLERWVVLLWMQLIHVDLPALVQRTFAYDLQRMTLKDLQPQICDAIDSLLDELNNSEQLKSARSRIATPNRSRGQYRPPQSAQYGRQGGKSYTPSYGPPRSSSQTQSRPRKECQICKAYNRRFLGHTIVECDYLSPGERKDIRASMVDTSDDVPDDIEEQEDYLDHDNQQE